MTFRLLEQCTVSLKCYKVERNESGKCYIPQVSPTFGLSDGPNMKIRKPGKSRENSKNGPNWSILHQKKLLGPVILA